MDKLLADRRPVALLDADHDHGGDRVRAVRAESFKQVRDELQSFFASYDEMFAQLASH